MKHKEGQPLILAKQMTEQDQRNPMIRTKVLNVVSADYEEIVTVAKALGSPQRLRILDFLQTRVANVSEIGQALDMPLATVNLHLTQLEKAGLIHTNIVAARRGVQKRCARAFDTIIAHLPNTQRLNSSEKIDIHMPIGAFVDHNVLPTCGMVGSDDVIGQFDDPVTFYEPARHGAQLIWFGQGYLEYRFPYRATPERVPKSLEISMEICSEAAPHHLDWPSDIYLEINDVDIGHWTSPADFGGERGRLTPDWWGEWNSQYGLLKTWRVDQQGAFIDRRPLSAIALDDLALDQAPFICVRIGVKPDAENMGGMNIFGSTFGNHAQDIIMRLNY